MEKSIKNDHFEVERSSDGTQFSLQGKRNYNENTTLANGSQLYVFSDLHPVTGANFYRIKQVDLDGNYSYSKTIQVSIRKGVSRLYLQSNAVHDELVLMNPSQQMVRQIQVVDISGKIVKQYAVNSGNNNILLDTHALTTGYYLLRVNTAEGTVSMRLVKL